MRFASIRYRSTVALALLLAACGSGGGGDSGDVPGNDTSRPACVAKEDCNDGDGCTSDRCVAGRCEFVPLDCNDDNACTTDQCVDGACDHAAISGCCVDDKECDDRDFCTPDHCIDHECVIDAPVEGCCNTAEPCDDGNECTFDSCSLHKCAHEPDKKAGCCTKVDECLDGNACTTDSCTDGRCRHVNNGCCIKDADCLSADPCEVGTCDIGKQKCDFVRTADCCAQDADCPAVDCTTVACTNLACVRTDIANCCMKDADCLDECRTCTIPGGQANGTCTVKTTGNCCIATLLTTPFNDLLTSGFTVGGLGKTGYAATPAWVVDAKRSVSPPSSLYFGDPATHTYEKNATAPAGGRAVSGVLDLGRTLSPTLKFQLFKATDITPSTDVLTVVIVVAGKPDRVAWSSASQSLATTKDAWLPVSVDLAAYQGEQVQVAFDFDTIPPAWSSSYEGVYVDDVTISGICPP